MTADVIQFGDLVLRREREPWRFPGLKTPGCPHRHLTLSDEGDIVTCDDCQKQVSAYWALRTFCAYWSEHERKIKSAREQLKQDTAGQIHFIAAKRMEAAWRRRRTVPACPHCYRGILPTDRFHAASKDGEMKKRAEGKTTNQEQR